MADAGTATISSTYLFLKLKGGSDRPAKRINFPRSYKQLLNIARSTFGHMQSINSLLTSDGIIISDMSQIIPGDTLYVSSKIHDENNQENTQNSTQSKNASNKKAEKSIKAAGSFNLLFGREKKKQNDESSEVLSKNDEEINDNDDNKETFNSQINDDDLTNQEHARTMPKPKASKRKYSRQSDDVSDQNKKSKTSKRFSSTRETDSQVSRESENQSRIRMSPAGSTTNSKYDNFLDEDDDDKSKDPDNDTNTDYMTNSTNLSRENSSVSSKSQKRKADMSRTAPIQQVTSLESDASSNTRRNKRSQIPMPSQTVRAPSMSDVDNDNASSNQKSLTVMYHNSMSSASVSNAPSVVSVDNQNQEEGVEPGNEEFQKLMDETVEPGTLQNVLDETLEQMPDYSNAIRKLPNFELEQTCHWYREGLLLAQNQNLPPLPEDVFGIDDMIGKVRCILMEHRFSERAGSTYRLNFGIVGPQGSGKSVFLRVFLEELFADLVTTGEWKDTFIFMQDLTNIVSYSTSPIQFYRSFLNATLDSFTWARPTLVPYIGVIHKMFEDVTSLKNAPRFNMAFSLNPEMQHYAAELQTIINKLSLIWNDEECLAAWINSIVFLPMIISQAFGFKKCIYVLDHYDFADTVFNPSNSKFGESPSAVSLIDVINSALMHCNFVISCSNQRDFLGLVEQFPGEEAIKPKLELISTIGLMQEATHEDQQITITFIDDTFPTIITCDACGGIPLFQYHWNAINDSIDQIENEENEESQEELNDMLNVQVQNAMKYFFVDEDGEQKIHEVTSVKRKTIQKMNNEQ